MAIEEGATRVRLGTTIFGSRESPTAKKSKQEQIENKEAL